MEVLNSWTKLLNGLTTQLYYDASITFRILVKIIHTVAGHTDDPEEKFNGQLLWQQAPSNIIVNKNLQETNMP